MSYTHSVLVTGGTANLGYYATLEIARKHPEYEIIIASRTDPDKAADKINQLLNQKNVSFAALDLSSTDNVRKFAKDWAAANHAPIKALVLNAGLQFPGGMEKNAEGVEKTFAINHLGHALLFHLLWPHLSNDARVVVTASGTHDPAQKTGLPDAIYNSAEELAHPTAETAKYEGRQRYATSKLVNMMWTYALDRKLKHHASQKNVTVTAMDPGLMPGTGLARDASFVVQFLWKNVLPHIIPLLRKLMYPNIHSAQESGQALARLAIAEDVEGVSGKYFEGMKEIESSKDSYDVEKQHDLWSWTVTYLAKGDKVQAAKFDQLQ